jgi:glycosyltransferase involved in cell wall biosynthesis
LKRIDILLPVHGEGRFLAQTISSIEKQTDLAHGLIAINDRAEKSALDILEMACAKNSNFKN